MKNKSTWLLQLAIASTLMMMTLSVLASGDEPYLRLNEVNIHAIRDFKNRYPSISTDKWLRLDNGYLAKFTVNQVPERVYYDNNGIFILRTRYFTGNTMPADLKDLIQQHYPGYSIVMVTEVSDEKNSYYRINIKDQTSVKTLRVVNAEIEVLEDFTS